MNKKQKISIILAILLGIMLIHNIFSGNSKRTPVSNQTEAQKVVEELHSPDKYKISFKKRNSMPSTLFEGKIGRKLEEDDWEGNKLVGIYAFGVSNLKGEQGQVWVSDDGGIIEDGVGRYKDGYFHLVR